jgi:hypothetical protein
MWLVSRQSMYRESGGWFNCLGFGNLAGQIGEIRISSAARYCLEDRKMGDRKMEWGVLDASGWDEGERKEDGWKRR